MSSRISSMECLAVVPYVLSKYDGASCRPCQQVLHSGCHTASEACMQPFTLNALLPTCRHRTVGKSSSRPDLDFEAGDATVQHTMG
jgi:hypothetical protein